MLGEVYGDFLRSVRRSRGLSQADLARTSGISQPNLSAYENDRRTPTVDVLNRILVSCGYQLAAVAGTERVVCPLPTGGWFPDEDRPPRLADDPADEEPVLRADSPWEQRRAVIEAVWAAVDDLAR